MRFLYGDSVRFPLGFDFLATLEAFMTAATHVVMLEAETKAQGDELAQLSHYRMAGVESVQHLHQCLVQSLDTALGSIGPRGTISSGELHPAAYEYAKQIEELSTRLVEGRQLAAKEEAEREGLALRAASGGRAAEVQRHLEAFFRSAELPVINSRVSLKLSGVGKEAHSEIGVVFGNHGDIITSFALGTSRHPQWQHPRRVAEFAPSLSLRVGVKKAFFRGTVTTEPIALDEYLISRLDVHDAGAELCLRKKVDAKDSYRFALARTEGHTAGRVEWLHEPNAAGLSPELAAEDVAQVDALCQKLRAALGELFGDRDAMIHLKIDGRDVFKEQLAMTLVARLVHTFAPIVDEIAARSPSNQELSLKREHDDGKREEIYLRRDELLKKLQPLNADGRSFFAPLGLDDWVPTITVCPPKAE